MNAQLLTAFSDAAPVKSGLGALLSKSLGTKEGGVSFARLLSQQSDTIDPKLLEMLQNLDADPKAQKELLGQFKDADVDPNLLSQLIGQLNIKTNIHADVASKSPAELLNKELGTEAKNGKNATDFINATLFIANESKSLRVANSALATTKEANTSNTDSKNIKGAKDANTSALSNSRFELNADPTLIAKKQVLTAAAVAANTSNNSSQTTARTFAENLKADQIETIGSSNANINTNASTSSLISDLNSGLSAVANQATPTNAQTASPFSATYNAQVQTPLSQTAQWGADFGRVMVQISQQAGQNNQAGLQTAEIRLDPPELGPLRIVLSVNDSVASAMIFAAHAQTRLTVEQALPQLQQQLAQAGLSLGEASVSDQGFFAQSEQQSNQDNQNQSTAFSLTGLNQDANGDGSNANTNSQRIDPNAIIDTFA